MKKIRTNIHLTEKQRTEIKRIAKCERITKATVVRNAIDAYIVEKKA